MFWPYIDSRATREAWIMEAAIEEAVISASTQLGYASLKVEQKAVIE